MQLPGLAEKEGTLRMDDPEPMHARGGGEDATVLIVDDDPSVRASLVKLLERDGVGVVTAEDGEEALAAFAEHEPDVVVMDVIMPRMDGIEVCRRLKGDPRSRLTPVVLVTGLDAREDRIRGIEAGADDFLSKPFDAVELLARVRSLLRMKRYTDELERAEAILFALARAIEARDPYTEGHCERLSRVSVLLGRRMGLDDGGIEALRRGGIVHDIGKVVVPDAILRKEGALSPAERTVMEQHPVAGDRICKGLRSFATVLPIIRHHHERMDGSGYPDGLRREQIPLTARILQIVDVFDALTTERPYKPAVSAEEALSTLADEVRRGWWDPDVFEAFRELARGHPDLVTDDGGSREARVGGAGPGEG